MVLSRSQMCLSLGALRLLLIIKQIFLVRKSRPESGNCSHRAETIHTTDCKRYTIPMSVLAQLRERHGAGVSCL